MTDPGQITPPGDGRDGPADPPPVRLADLEAVAKAVAAPFVVLADALAAFFGDVVTGVMNGLGIDTPEQHAAKLKALGIDLTHLKIKPLDIDLNKLGKRNGDDGNPRE